MTTTTSSPVESVQLDRKDRYRLGSKLGQGARGTVYKLKHVASGVDHEWCAKITPKAKPTKNKRSEDEASERQLAFERQMYHNRLSQLQGRDIPKIPKAEGETRYLELYKVDDDGWNFLVMEQMETTLMRGVLDIAANASGNSIRLGPIAIRLVEILQTIHSKALIVTDVKADNFMLARSPNHTSKTEEDAASRLRIVDLGLLKDYRLGKQHEPNTGATSLRGTPLYASIQVHDLQTPSRRDDMESIVYLVADLVFAIHSQYNGTQKKDVNNGSFLPWSNAGSDSAIRAKKLELMENRASEFYQPMSENAAKTIFACWKKCREYKYKQEPDYEYFIKAFQTLTVQLPDRKRKSRASASRNSQSRRKLSEESTPVPMEIDEVWDADENTEPDIAVGNGVALGTGTLKTHRKFYAATVTAISGPHKGEKWILQEDGQEKYCIGQQPSKRNFLPLALHKDKKVQTNHAKFTLSPRPHSLLIVVQNIKSSSAGNETVVDKKVLTGNAEMAVLHGQCVQIGDTVLKIAREEPTMKTKKQKQST